VAGVFMRGRLYCCRDQGHGRGRGSPDAKPGVQAARRYYNEDRQAQREGLSKISDALRRDAFHPAHSRAGISNQLRLHAQRAQAGGGVGLTGPPMWGAFMIG